MVESTDVVVIGAGPYGLSIASHLASHRLEHRVFGKPMHAWETQMPRGMQLKSDGFASNLWDPCKGFTLRRYCGEHRIPYEDVGLPVNLDTFAAYGREFQKRFVPALDPRHVISLDVGGRGFVLSFDTGPAMVARRVVVATGLWEFAHIPDRIRHLPPDLLSHSSESGDLERFKGGRIVVLGGGASAIDIAVLASEMGVDVALVLRDDVLHFHDRMRLPRPLWDRVRNPMSGIGPSWKSRLFADYPRLFQKLPAGRRLDIARTYLGPAGGWFMKDRLRDVRVLPGCEVADARVDRELQLSLRTACGRRLEIRTDHLVAATGFRVALPRMGFLAEGLRRRIAALDDTPVLSGSFQSSVPGLYFVGPASANSFGPVMRFAFGAKFTAAHISRHLVNRTSPHALLVGPGPSAFRRRVPPGLKT